MRSKRFAVRVRVAIRFFVSVSSLKGFFKSEPWTRKSGVNSQGESAAALGALNRVPGSSSGCSYSSVLRFLRGRSKGVTGSYAEPKHEPNRNRKFVRVGNALFSWAQRLADHTRIVLDIRAQARPLLAPLLATRLNGLHPAPLQHPHSAAPAGASNPLLRRTPTRGRCPGETLLRRPAAAPIAPRGGGRARTGPAVLASRPGRASEPRRRICVTPVLC